MFPVRIRLSTEGMLSKRAWRRIAKAAHTKMGDYWQQRVLPRHFTKSARRRYGHKPRSKKWRERKMREAKKGNRGVEGGGEIDNVYTGNMRDLLMSGRLIRAYATRFSVEMFGPRYISMRPFQSNQPDKAAEITKTLPDEAAAMAKIGDATAQVEIDRNKGRTRG